MNSLDLRVIKTLDNIDNSLLKNIQALPFSKVTVNMLCNTARVNRSTFYNYYEDKYDLLNKYIDKILDEFSESVSTEFVIASKEELTPLAYSNNFKKLINPFVKNKEVYYILWNSAIDRNVYEEMTSIIEKNILSDLKNNFNIDSEKEEYITLFSHLFASDIMILIKWWLKSNDHISLESLVKLGDNITNYGLYQTLRKVIENE